MNGLNEEANRILSKLQLLELLQVFGEAQVVGSVALDLIVKLDIDLYLLVNTPNLLPVVDAVYHRLLDKPGVREVRISDYRDEHGVKIGIDTYPEASGDWSIDIWVTNCLETTGEALTRRLLQTLTPEQRDTILAIKRYYYQKGLLRDSLSMHIYQAVVDQEVHDQTGFEAWRKANHPPKE